MIFAQNKKETLSSVGTIAGTATSYTCDLSTGDYNVAKFYYNPGTNSIAPSFILSESDSTAATSFSTATIDSTLGVTVSASTNTISVNWMFPTVGRKRYLKVTVSVGTPTGYAGFVHESSRLHSSVAGTSDMGATYVAIK